MVPRGQGDGLCPRKPGIEGIASGSPRKVRRRGAVWPPGPPHGLDCGDHALAKGPEFLSWPWPWLWQDVSRPEVVQDLSQ